MEDVQIGSTDAEINKIVIAIIECPDFHNFGENLPKLGTYLNTPVSKVKKWKQNLLLGIDQPDYVVGEVVSEFLCRVSKEATVFALASAFESAGMTNTGDILRQKFGRKVANDKRKQAENSNIFPLQWNDIFNTKFDDLAYISHDDITENDKNDGNCFPKPAKSHDVVDLRSGEPLENPTPIPPTSPMKFQDDDYKLPITNKGLALIINIISYNGRYKYREGARVDSWYMYHIWTSLGYKVQLEHEGIFDKERIKNIINDFVDKCNQTKPKSVVVFLGGHGQHENLVMSDGLEKMHYYKDIINKFTDPNCRLLRYSGGVGEPKIFLISACQGWSADESDGGECHLDHAIVGYSTLPGYFSNRNTGYGTTYAYCLTKVLVEESHKLDFEKILKRVHEIMKRAKTNKTLHQQSNY